MKKKQKASAERLIKKALLSCLTILLSLSFWWIEENLHPAPLPQSDREAILYSNQMQGDLKEVFVQAISEARESVLLAIYHLTDSSIIHALTQKSLQGISIKIITDGRDNPFLERKLPKDIQVLKRFGPGLMHLKVLVIDHERVLIGSANMTGDSLRLNGNLVVGLQSAPLAQYATKKLSSMPEEGEGEPFLAYECQCGEQKIELWFLPDTGGLAQNRIKKLIGEAKKTIRVAMFTWTRMDFAQDLFQASKRGVKVEAVIDRNAGKGVGAKVIQYLKDNNIHVRLSSGSNLLHHKYILFDGETLINGSANWTKAAFTTNDDCFMIVTPLTSEQKQAMDQLWKILKSDSTPSN